MTQLDEMPDLDPLAEPAGEASHTALARLTVMLACGQSENRLVAEAAAIITAWVQALVADAEHLRVMLLETLKRLRRDGSRDPWRPSDALHQEVRRVVAQHGGLRP